MTGNSHLTMENIFYDFLQENHFHPRQRPYAVYTNTRVHTGARGGGGQAQDMSKETAEVHKSHLGRKRETSVTNVGWRSRLFISNGP